MQHSLVKFPTWDQENLTILPEKLPFCYFGVSEELSAAQIAQTKQIKAKKKEQCDILHKSETQDLFQHTSPNPIKWAFLDEFSSNSGISQKKALELTCPSVMRKLAF